MAASNSMFGTKHGFAQSMDCAAQGVDLCFVHSIHGLHNSQCAKYRFESTHRRSAQLSLP